MKIKDVSDINLQFFQELDFTLNLRCTVCIISKSINKQLQPLTQICQVQHRSLCLKNCTNFGGLQTGVQRSIS